MKNHFYISYTGNKREEVETIYNNLDFEGIDTIIEPFCGSQAMSYYISLNKKGLKYIFNDNNKLLKEMYEIMIDDEKIKEFEKLFNETLNYIYNDKEKYNEVVNRHGTQSLLSFFISHKVYTFRPFICPPINNREWNYKINLKTCPIYNFYKNNDIEFYDDDWLKIYLKYKDCSNCLFLFDPPYLSTCNDFYLDSSVNVYEYFFNNPIDKEKAKIYLILENIWIIKLLFKNNEFIIYNKNYNGYKKKKAEHIIIKNKLT